MNKSRPIERIAVIDFAAILAELEKWVNVEPIGNVFSDDYSEPTAEEIAAERKRKEDEISAIHRLEGESENEPVFFARRYKLPDALPKGDYQDRDMRVLVFRGFLYRATGPHTIEEFKLLTRAEYDGEQRKFERLHATLVESEKREKQPSRERIPSKVRREVWQRDGGKCVECGSNERLEYDHIIPVSKGGANTARNIQLLCEPCNRAKGDEIG